MVPFPDLSPGRRRRHRLSLLFTVALVLCLVGNVLRKADTGRKMQATSQAGSSGEASSVQQENSTFWGLAGSFRDQMNQAVQDGYEQSKRDNAEFDRRLREEQQQKQNRINNGEAIEP